MKSCIFEGQVRHARSVPVAHSFRYRVFYMYLDLDELPALFAGRWLWSADRWAPARFRRADHLGDQDAGRTNSPAYPLELLWLLSESGQFLLLLLR